MKLKQIGVALLKLAVLAACAAGLFWLWKDTRSHEPEGAGEEAVHSDVEVHVGSVTRRTFWQYVSAYGTVIPAPPAGGQRAGSARIMSAVPGALSEILCSEGQRVDKGTPLFKLDSRVADAAVARQRDALAYAEQTLARQQQLVTTGGTPVKTVQEAEQQVRLARIDLNTALAQQALLQIAAPSPGTVVRIEAKQGEAVDLTTTLAEVVDLDRLVVTAAVPSADLGNVKVDQEAYLTADSAPPRADGAQAPPTSPADAPQGRVMFINPTVDPKSDLGSMLVSLPAGAPWRPGQLIGLRVIVDEHADRLAAPIQSVVEREDGQKVVCVADGGRAVQKPVRTVLQEGDWVEIEGDGIIEGLPIVINGAYGLPNETKIHAVPTATTRSGVSKPD